MLENEARDLLKGIKEDDLILTVGNPLREDDGVGWYIYEQIKSLRHLEGRVFHTDQNPSIGINLAEQIRPKRLILIDAADFGGPAGMVKLLKATEVEDTFLSTHEIPISVMGEGIKKEYGCDVCYIGVQVKGTGFGELLSEEVKLGADEVIKDIIVSIQ